VVAFCLLSVGILSLLATCTAPSDEAAPSSIEVKDQLDRVVKLDKIPERIISLAPSNTEILFALGLADKVVGVTDYCNYPPQAQEKPSVGGFSTPNIEEVIALSPDLILATSIHEERIMPQLEEKGTTVFALNPKTLDEVLESITLGGEITGKDEEASQLVAEMRNRVKAVTDKTGHLSEAERPRVFCITWHDPLMTPGSGTRHDELIVKAGETSPTTSVEAVLKKILE
jgi:iron complex transport system substrate-binding protein